MLCFKYYDRPGLCPWFSLTAVSHLTINIKFCQMVKKLSSRTVSCRCLMGMYTHTALLWLPRASGGQFMLTIFPFRRKRPSRPPVDLSKMQCVRCLPAGYSWTCIVKLVKHRLHTKLGLALRNSFFMQASSVLAGISVCGLIESSS